MFPVKEANVGKKTIAVVGATGAQGGGLVRAILGDPAGGFGPVVCLGIFGLVSIIPAAHMSDQALLVTDRRLTL